MPTLSHQSISTYYLQEGQGQDIVCLYGWAQDTRLFEPTLHHLKDRFRVTVLDFPGFGQSTLMPKPWGVPEYTEWLKEVLTALKIENPIFIAHSFGARVALMYASKYPVCKMVLTGAAGLRPKRHLDYYLRIYSFKMLKKISLIHLLKPLTQPYLRSFGSDDYKALEGVLRQSFVKIVNENLRPLLPKITAPTLLIWGEKDTATPLWMGQVMEKEMQDAGLVIFEKEDHYAYWNQLNRFHTIIDTFVEKEAHHG